MKNHVLSRTRTGGTDPAPGSGTCFGWFGTRSLQAGMWPRHYFHEQPPNDAPQALFFGK